jgi:hypothetical protein
MLLAITEKTEAEFEERETENRKRDTEKERESWHYFFYGKPFRHNPLP